LRSGDERSEVGGCSMVIGVEVEVHHEYPRSLMTYLLQDGMRVMREKGKSI
jgi:hypothetical protein